MAPERRRVINEALAEADWAIAESRRILPGLRRRTNGCALLSEGEVSRLVKVEDLAHEARRRRSA